MDDEPIELIEFLAPYPEAVQNAMLEGRTILQSLVGPATELIYDATSAVGCGFTYTHKPTDNFVNLAAFSDHATLVFAWGVNLDDPEGRLKGEGARVRHIRLPGAEALRDPYVSALIVQASTKAARPPTPLEPTKIVKIYNGPKRRPKSKL